MAHIDKKLLHHLAELSRLEINADEEEKFLREFEDILNHFKELEGVNTDAVLPMAGGGDMQNVFRGDEVKGVLDSEVATKAFPDAEKGLLKVPPIFDER